MQEVLHLDHLHDRREQARQGEDLGERDERRRHEHAEVERERRRRDLAGEQGNVGVEGDGGEEQGERDHQHHRQEDERVRGLIVGKALRERERRDAEGSAEGDEREMACGGLDTPIALDLEGERAHRYEQSEHEQAEDGERRGNDEDTQRGRADGERGGEEVVRGLVEPDIEHEQEQRGQDHQRRELTERRDAEVEIEERAGGVRRDVEDKAHRRRDRDERERRHDHQPLAKGERETCRDAEQQRRRGDDGHASRTARSLTMRNAPTSATTTSSQPRRTLRPSWGASRSLMRSSTPVIISSAPSDPRTGVRAVTRIATPDEMSQKLATWAVTPLGSSPTSGTTGVSALAVRSVAKHAAVAAAATIVASQSRHPGSSP